MAIGNLKRATDCPRRNPCIQCPNDLFTDCCLLRLYRKRGSMTQFRKLLEEEIAKKRSEMLRK